LYDQSLFGVEALLRWHHDDFGQLPTEKIIAVAEESGLIIPIGDWVVQEAFRQYTDWKLKDNDTAIKLAINISSRQLDHDDWILKLKQVIKQYSIDPHSLIFELTETDVIKHMPNTKESLSALVTMGAQVFIDDFGMGYSSLNMIKNLPVSGFKIDKSCIQDISDNLFSGNLVQSLFILTKNMGYTVVAEGIETKEQLDFLKTYVQEKGQGYYLSTPLSSQEIKKLLRKYGKV